MVAWLFPATESTAAYTYAAPTATRSSRDESLPLGYEISSCASGPRCRNTAGAHSVPRNHARPAADMIGRPALGRQPGHQATEQQRKARGSVEGSELRLADPLRRHPEGEPGGPQRIAEPAHRPQAISAASASPDSSIGFGMNARAWLRASRRRNELAAVAGGSDDSGRIARLAQSRRHSRTRRCREAEHRAAPQLRPQPLRSSVIADSPSVASPTTRMPSRLQQRTGNLPEALVVIDDQDGKRHRTSVASPTRTRTRANPGLSRWHCLRERRQPNTGRSLE